MGDRRELLRDARVAAGHTLESLAEAVEVNRSTAIRWERGVSNPQPRQRPKLAAALRLSLAHVDMMLSERLSPGDLDEPLSRRPVQNWPPQPVGEAERVTYAGSVDLVSVGALRDSIRRINALYDTTPSATLVDQAAQSLARIRLLKSRATGRVLTALCGAEAEAALLVGQLIWDASQRRAGQATRLYFEQARTIARQIRDPATEGLALLRQAFVELYGSRDAAAGLALVCQAVASGRETSPVIAGVGLLHAAEAHAMLNDRPSCERALGEAENHLADRRVEDPAAELYSPSQPARLAGSCYLFLGDNRRAQEILHEATRSFGSLSKADAIIWANLGLASLRRREVDRATHALHRAIDIIEVTRAGGGLNVVFEAGRELRPWRDHAMVEEVHERLFGLMTTPAGIP
jgi:transcriptional regulator with XRE-family HTH domain